ncbi:MAG: pyridoxamine 5'-phosphate oxidase family protein [Bacteroidales bacterium]|nr:pyridoxamine 5'-phosphate oxidase family protein [Bacteroidales bacterium]MCF8391803.1 pyridoxamine 5'-phosphate oxidase family protein [Bacteroidales bacterium]
MRRKEKEIIDQSLIEEIIQQGLICRIGINGSDYPYIVPVNYGYRDNCLYFHSACEGKKISMLKNNPNVCIQIDTDISIAETEIPCNWSTRYQSVIGFGKAIFIENVEEKRRALDIIVRHYKKDLSEDYPYGNLDRLCVIKIELSLLTGKQSL